MSSETGDSNTPIVVLDRQFSDVVEVLEGFVTNDKDVDHYVFSLLKGHKEISQYSDTELKLALTRQTDAGRKLKKLILSTPPRRTNHGNNSSAHTSDDLGYALHVDPGFPITGEIINSFDPTAFTHLRLKNLSKSLYQALSDKAELINMELAIGQKEVEGPYREQETSNEVWHPEIGQGGFIGVYKNTNAVSPGISPKTSFDILIVSRPKLKVSPLKKRLLDELESNTGAASMTIDDFVNEVNKEGIREHMDNNALRLLGNYLMLGKGLRAAAPSRNTGDSNHTSKSLLQLIGEHLGMNNPEALATEALTSRTISPATGEFYMEFNPDIATRFKDKMEFKHTIFGIPLFHSADQSYRYSSNYANHAIDTYDKAHESKPGFEYSGFVPAYGLCDDDVGVPTILILPVGTSTKTKSPGMPILHVSVKRPEEIGAQLVRQLHPHIAGINVLDCTILEPVNVVSY